jgi:GLPGLI family protein
MMKNKNMLLTILILFLNINLIFSQLKSAEITYKKASATVLKKTNEPETHVDIMLKKSEEAMNKFEYSLKFNKSESFFNEVKNMNIENESAISFKLGKMFGETDGTYYTNRISGKMYHEKEFEGELLLVEYQKINDWKLTQEQKKIANYTCYKATKKDSYIGSSGNKIIYEVIAWYTPEIPFPFGPTKYEGLPGLILEVTNHQAIIYASKIVLSNVKEIEIKKPNKNYKHITNSKHDSIKMGLATDFRKKYKRN